MLIACRLTPMRPASLLLDRTRYLVHGSQRLRQASKLSDLLNLNRRIRAIAFFASSLDPIFTCHCWCGDCRHASASSDSRGARPH
jgi:hypothetical protein